MPQKVDVSPPSLLVVPSNLATELGAESVATLVMGRYVEEYFGRILAEIGDKKVGLRAIYCSETTGNRIEVHDWNGSHQIEVTSISDIVAQGGEYKGLPTLLTVTGENDELENPEVKMTEEYLRFAVKECLLSDGSVFPAILVYDLSNAVHEPGTYQWIFPDQRTKVNSLLAIYPIDITPLRSELGKEQVGKAE